MPTPVRGRHATVVAYLALSVALGGTSWAVTTIDSRDIERNAVRSKHVGRDALKGADVNEATLDTVPSATTADRLDGLDSTDFLRAGGSAADADRLDGLDSADFLRSDGTAANATNADQLDGLDSAAFAAAGHDHDAAYVNVGEQNSVDSDMISNVFRSVPLPLASFADCQTDAGGLLGFGGDDAADNVPDFNNSPTDGQGFTLRWDDGATTDEDAEVCSQFVVPDDYLPNHSPAFRFRSSKPSETGNAERLELAVSIDGAALGGTNSRGIAAAPSTAFLVPLGISGVGPGDVVSVFFRAGSLATLDDAVDIHAVEFTYISIQ